MSSTTASWDNLLVIPDKTDIVTEEELEQHMESMYRDMLKANPTQNLQLTEEAIQEEACRLKPLVFSSQSPTPSNPAPYYPMSVVTFVYNRGILTPWQIANYRKWSRKPYKARRITNISKKTMVWKIQIDYIIREYFSKV